MPSSLRNWSGNARAAAVIVWLLTAGSVLAQDRTSLSLAAPDLQFGPPEASPQPTAAPPVADLPTAQPPLLGNSYPLGQSSPSNPDQWNWQLLPAGIIYHSYLAGPREPRFSSVLGENVQPGGIWDSTVGTRLGLIRYGNHNPCWPEGWQWDVEGAAFALFNGSRDLQDLDFRYGTVLTRRVDQWEAKIGYAHLCSHEGDQFMLANPTIPRVENVRDTIVSGVAWRPDHAVRIYAEASWAFYTEGVTQPWEFQFGVEYSTMDPAGFAGAPFFAANARLRQEVNFGGSVNVQAGWQWRSPTGQLLRTGAFYTNGKNDQGQFYNQYESEVGGGIWYDF